MQISQISVTSRISSPQQRPVVLSNCQISTQTGHHSNHSNQTTDQNLSKAAFLLKQISKLQIAHNEMQKKFQKCIDSLTKQIEQKQITNNKMMIQVSQLKSNIEQSKRDIQVISAYAKKNNKPKNHTKKHNQTQKHDQTQKMNADQKGNDVQKKMLVTNSPKKIQINKSFKVFKKSLQRKSPQRLINKQTTQK